MIYRTPKNKRIYRQYDEKWASLPYPTKNYSFGGSGCGACSVLHCIIEMKKYRTKTPAFVQPYMVQYAVKGNGTTWEGITKGLAHYGLKNAKRLDNMPDVWAELKKGDRVAVFLFNNNLGPDGTRWTSGGHYVAAVGFKIVNGKHWLFMNDSGGRKNDGWKCYERSMLRCVRAVFVARVPGEIVLPKRGYFKRGDISSSVKIIQTYLTAEGFYKGKINGTYGKLTAQAVIDWQKKNGLKVDGLWGPECNARYEED